MKTTAALSLLVLCIGLLVCEGDPPATGEMAGDKVLRIALFREPVTLDAHRLNVATDGRMVGDLGATLVTLHPTTGELLPYLANDWSVSDDGLRWTFQLRDDVLFHDGTPFTADTYVWTLNRILALTGPDSFVPRTVLSKVIAARSVDRYTLEIELQSPDATLIYGLVNPYLQPLSPQAIESAGDHYGLQPVGVGPFRLKEWVPGQKIVLERNPDYTWGPSFTSGGPAQLDQIEYVVIPDYELALVELLDHQIDVMQIQHGDARRVLAGGSLAVLQVLSASSPIYLALDMTQPPLDDLRVRQALNYAVDREQMVSIVEYGYGKPHYGPILPAVIGYWPGTDEAGYHYDPARASALLADAGYVLDDQGVLVKDDQSLSLMLYAPQYAQLPQLPQVIELLSSQLRQVGIQLTTLYFEVPELIAAAADPAGFDLIINAVTWPEATFILSNLFLSNSAYNFGSVQDPELDQMIGASQSSIDLAAGRQLLWDAQQRVIERAYSAPLYGISGLFAVNRRVQNFSQTEYGRWLIDTTIE